MGKLNGEGLSLQLKTALNITANLKRLQAFIYFFILPLGRVGLLKTGGYFIAEDAIFHIMA